MEQVFRFGAFEVTLCRENELYRGVCKMDKPPYKADFPSILTEGVPFVVTREGVGGEYTKYLFPSLIPVIVKKCRVFSIKGGKNGRGKESTSGVFQRWAYL